MPRHAQSGQANLTTILLLLGLVVSGVWVWKRLSPDMQDLIIDQALPLAALVARGLGGGVDPHWKDRQAPSKEISSGRD
ncbi:MAG: hypothetical protein IPI70_05905 [Nitrospira sp.]|nr:hypothetical protein [Nitrospira sp.]